MSVQGYEIKAPNLSKSERSIHSLLGRSFLFLTVKLILLTYFISSQHPDFDICL